MSTYFKPLHETNEKFNVLNFNWQNELNFDGFDIRYFIKDENNVMYGKNIFVGATYFLNGISSFYNICITSCLSVAYSISTATLLASNIITNNITVKTINNKPINLNIGVYITINNIQYPILKSINNTLISFTNLDLQTLLNDYENNFIILLPNYKILMFDINNILLQKIENSTNDIYYELIEFKFTNLLCSKIKIYYNNKLIQ